MALKEKLEADVKTAMLAKNEIVRDTLRLLLSELKRLDLQEGKVITPDIEQDVLLKAVKMRQQSIAEFDKAGRADLVAKEKAELAVIQGYLPKSLSDGEAESAIKSLMSELNITSKKDMGTLMKAVMAKYKGQIDGKKTQELLGRLLT
ncbi:MAG: GatB/YqeY domain-containing protein [Planctomycetota bacterium]|nr:GatB/YqeY domain-containing protein [Planctomycetota bacterium]